MTIFSELAAEWRDGEQHVSDWFTRHGRDTQAPGHPGDTITPDHPERPAPGAPMSLAAIAAASRAAVEHGAADIRTFLDEHLTQIEELGALVDANPVFASAQNAAHVPLEILQGVATLLDTMAAAHPKPEPAPAADAPAEPAAEQAEQAA